MVLLSLCALHVRKIEGKLILSFNVQMVYLSLDELFNKSLATIGCIHPSKISLKET